jgi:hypothetical protein
LLKFRIERLCAASNLVEAIMARPVMRPRSKPDPIDIGGETNIRPLSE